MSSYNTHVHHAVTAGMTGLGCQPRRYIRGDGRSRQKINDQLTIASNERRQSLPAPMERLVDVDGDDILWIYQDQIECSQSMHFREFQVIHNLSNHEG